MSSLAPGTSAMRQTMDGQADALAQILGDEEPVMQVAERLRGRRVLAIGTGPVGTRPVRPLSCCGRPAWMPGPRNRPTPRLTARCLARGTRCWRSPTPGPSATRPRPLSVHVRQVRTSSRYLASASTAPIYSRCRASAHLLIQPATSAR